MKAEKCGGMLPQPSPPSPLPRTLHPARERGAPPRTSSGLLFCCLASPSPGRGGGCVGEGDRGGEGQSPCQSQKKSLLVRTDASSSRFCSSSGERDPSSGFISPRI